MHRNFIYCKVARRNSVLIFNPFLSGRGKTTHAEVQKFFKPTHDVHNLQKYKDAWYLVNKICIEILYTVKSQVETVC